MSHDPEKLINGEMGYEPEKTKRKVIQSQRNMLNECKRRFSLLAKYQCVDSRYQALVALPNFLFRSIADIYVFWFRFATVYEACHKLSFRVFHRFGINKAIHKANS